MGKLRTHITRTILTRKCGRHDMPMSLRIDLPVTHDVA